MPNESGRDPFKLCVCSVFCLSFCWAACLFGGGGESRRWHRAPNVLRCSVVACPTKWQLCENLMWRNAIEHFFHLNGTHNRNSVQKGRHTLASLHHINECGKSLPVNVLCNRLSFYFFLVYFRWMTMTMVAFNATRATFHSAKFSHISFVMARWLWSGRRFSNWYASDISMVIGKQGQIGWRATQYTNNNRKLHRTSVEVDPVDIQPKPNMSKLLIRATTRQSHIPIRARVHP